MNYELIGLIITVVGSVIKFSIDYANLKKELEALDERVKLVEKQEETIFHRIDELKEHNTQVMGDLEITLTRVETKLDMIMSNFEMNIKE